MRAINARFVTCAGEWSASTLSEKISFEFVGGGDGLMSREDILIHLVNHSTYHRGFVSILRYPQGPEFAATDYTVFLRDV
ncbi:MAG: DinB family protein [Pseudomonadota bacterium]